MQSLRATRQPIEASLEDFRDRIEPTPGRLALAKFRMTRITPFVENVWNLRRRNDPGIQGLDLRMENRDRCPVVR